MRHIIIFKVTLHETFMNILLKLNGMHISRGAATWPYDKAMSWVFLERKAPWVYLVKEMG